MPRTKTHWHVALYDMPDVDGMVQRMGRARTERVTVMADKIYREASSRSVISPAMAEKCACGPVWSATIFFAARSSRKQWPGSAYPPKPPDDVIRIGYAGVIIAEPTFVRLVKALQSIAGNSAGAWKSISTARNSTVTDPGSIRTLSPNTASSARKNCMTITGPGHGASPSCSG